MQFSNSSDKSDEVPFDVLIAVSKTSNQIKITNESNKESHSILKAN